MKKTFYILALGIAIGIIIMQLINIVRINKIESYETLLEVKVTNEFINVRSQPTPLAKKIYEVVKNEKYKVVEVFDENKNYKWYKIIYLNRRTGWIASDKEDKWLEEL